MTRFFKLMILPLFALIALPSNGAPPDSKELEEVLAKMERAETEVRSLQFRFVQTAHIRVTGETQKIRGEAFFQRPDQFRVEHTSPRSQQVVSDGKKLWFYNPDQQQVVVDSWENWTKSAGFPKGLLPFQTGPSELRKKYSFQLEKKVKNRSNEEYVLRLDPIEAGPWPYRLRLNIDSASGIPVRTELESESVQTVTEISNIKINPTFKDEIFTFQPPKGVEVIEAPFE